MLKISDVYLILLLIYAIKKLSSFGCLHIFEIRKNSSTEGFVRMITLSWDNKLCMYILSRRRHLFVLRVRRRAGGRTTFRYQCLAISYLRRKGSNAIDNLAKLYSSVKICWRFLL